MTETEIAASWLSTFKMVALKVDYENECDAFKCLCRWVSARRVYRR